MMATKSSPLTMNGLVFGWDGFVSRIPLIQFFVVSSIFDSFRCGRGTDINVQLLNLIPENTFGYAERPGGLALNTIGSFQGVNDELAFEIMQRCSQVQLKSWCVG